jgi:hypothetical protein
MSVTALVNPIFFLFLGAVSWKCDHWSSFVSTPRSIHFIQKVQRQRGQGLQKQRERGGGGGAIHIRSGCLACTGGKINEKVCESLISV